MRLKHKGIRPLHSLALVDFKKKIYYEEYPCGKEQIWTKRMLISGCNKVVIKPREMRECYYCPTCDEWFSKDQWETV